MMNSNQPLITVLMPCFNESESIGGAIESILNQTYRNYELIIIDDNSTDKTIEIANQYASKDNRIRVLTKVGNLPKGPGVSRNIGTKLARGEYIVFMDADDFSEPERIEKQLEKALEKPGKMLVGCNIRIVKEDLTFDQTLPANHNEIIKGFKKLFGRGKYFVMGTALGPTKVFLRNPTKPILRYAEDWDQLVRIYESEDIEIANCQEFLYHYKQFGVMSSEKTGWIEANCFVRFSQRMRKKGLPDPQSFEDLSKYLNSNFIDFILCFFFRNFYILRFKFRKLKQRKKPLFKDVGFV